MHLVLFQPEIPQNTGTLLRLAACWNVPLHLIEPCGFVFTDKKLKRAGMDYVEKAHFIQHPSWSSYKMSRPSGRLIFLTPHGQESYTDFQFSATDHLLIGRESDGFPLEVEQEAHARLFIPMAPHYRSLNMAISAAIVLGEALRQTQQFPTSERNKNVGS